MAEQKKEKRIDKYMSSTKVGPKGQIVIPKEIRDMFSIEPGDMVLILADAEQGIAIQTAEMISAVTNSVFKTDADIVFEDNGIDSVLINDKGEKELK